MAIVNLEQIKHWETIKGASHWLSVTFGELKSTKKRIVLLLVSLQKNINDLLSFQFYLLGSENKETEYLLRKENKYIKF